MNFRTYLLSLLISAASLAAGDMPEAYSRKAPSLPQLERRLAEIDTELRTLARYSLRSGVGPIGFRSATHTNSVAREWMQVELGREMAFDQIVLVPAICHDSALGFRADAFPAGFRLLAGKNGDTNGTVLASFGPDDNLLPRIAPVIIPCPSSTASWVRLEAELLSPRAFDGKFNLELAEFMIFDGEENIALRKPLRSSSSSVTYSKARQLSCAVDGFLPYILHAAEGRPSIAYFTPTLQTKRPMLMIDLKARYPLNRLHLHAVDVDDVYPQSVPYDFCLPRKILIEGADKADFSDARPLTTFQSVSPYDRGPLIILTFPETRCRYVRLSAPDFLAQSDDQDGIHAIGFAEIEIFSKGVNVALEKKFSTNFKNPGGGGRPIAALTDGANFYGTVLPLRRWLEQLARRHDLDQERRWVNKELQLCYDRQKVLLQRVSWLSALLVFGLLFTVLADRLIRLRQIARIKERLAADLHDEIGANLHTIGILSDLADDAREEPEELTQFLARIRAMTERSGTAVRHFADLLSANGLYTDLVEDLRRISERIMVKFEQEIVIEGESYLRQLKPGINLDLLLFYKECLVNISRHSSATRFSTRLTATAKSLQLTVTDNGKGLSEGIPDSLKRRAKLMGAKVVCEGQETGGTTIRLTLRTRRWGWQKRGKTHEAENPYNADRRSSGVP